MAGVGGDLVKGKKAKRLPARQMRDPVPSMLHLEDYAGMKRLADDMTDDEVRPET